MPKSPVPYLDDAKWDALEPREQVLLTLAWEIDENSPREVGGQNRGPFVRKYLKTVGLEEGHPWCAGLISWGCRVGAGLDLHKMTGNGASACTVLTTRESKEPSIRFRLVPVKPHEVRRGDWFGWCDRTKWRGHIGVVVKVARDERGRVVLHTLEGNTNQKGSREGDKASRMVRHITPNMLFVRLERLP